MLACRACFFWHLQNQWQAPALYCDVALALGKDFQQVVFQSYCLTLVLKVEAVARDRTTAGSIVLPRKMLLQPM
jgi:hypothetical protein